MTRYYPALIHDADSSGTDQVAAYTPQPTYTAASERLAGRIPNVYWRGAVLLDLSSVTVAGPDELAVLLSHDPVLFAIYHLGLQRGRLLGELDEQNRQAAYAENPEASS